MSPQQRLQFFGGVSVWMRLGDGCLDNVGNGEDLMRALEYILTQLRGQQPSGDDDYHTIRRKLLAFQSTAHSRNVTSEAEVAAGRDSMLGRHATGDSKFSVSNMGAIVDGGAPSLPGGNILVDEARKVCGCMTLRTDLKVPRWCRVPSSICGAMQSSKGQCSTVRCRCYRFCSDRTPHRLCVIAGNLQRGE